jgi:hypothetical protein
VLYRFLLNLFAAALNVLAGSLDRIAAGEHDVGQSKHQRNQSFHDENSHSFFGPALHDGRLSIYVPVANTKNAARPRRGLCGAARSTYVR